MTDHLRHSGGCHCGDVRFEVLAPRDPTVTQCNCSICVMTGYEHLFVTQDEFHLQTDWKAIGLYQFNSKTARHYFCKRCGIKSFYVPRSHPDGYSVNVRCLDRETLGTVRYLPFDGANWEANIDKLHNGTQD